MADIFSVGLQKTVPSPDKILTGFLSEEYRVKMKFLPIFIQFRIFEQVPETR